MTTLLTITGNDIRRWQEGVLTHEADVEGPVTREQVDFFRMSPPEHCRVGYTDHKTAVSAR